MTTVVPVSGITTEAYAPLRDVLARLVAAGHRGGAALSVYRHGQPVVDLVAGAYATDTLQLVFSVSKAITAIATAVLERDGALDLDEPLAASWPEMRKPSTRSITLRDVLSHRSGLAAVDQTLTLDDLVAGRDVDAVGAQEPYWEPGTAHGYHAFTFSALVQRTYRARLGRTVGQVVQERLAEPLGLDLWLGTPDAVVPRIRPVLFEPPAVSPQVAEHQRTSAIPAGTTAQLAAHSDVYNSPELRRLGAPSTSAVAGARDLARLFAATLGLVDGVRLLDQADTARLTAERSNGADLVLGVRSAFGSGVQRPFPRFPMLGPGSFGHEAAGGSAALADVDADVAVGFTTDVHPPGAGASPVFSALLGALALCIRDDS